MHIPTKAPQTDGHSTNQIARYQNVSRLRRLTETVSQYHPKKILLTEAVLCMCALSGLFPLSSAPPTGRATEVVVMFC